jgi:glycerol-3-phosphate dehydrogenase
MPAGPVPSPFAPLRVDPSRLHGREVDLLVIGGGIQGAAIAREAAVRGLTPLLVESVDYASGTSSRSSRLVHGGVRYLQQGHISLVREALHERERLLRAAPHLVRPLPVLMPFFRDGGRSPFLLKTGLRIYSWLAGSSTLPKPDSVGADDCLRLFPGLRTRGLRGGALYFDAATQDAALALAVLEGAAAAGALLANHVEVVGLRDSSVRLVDRISGNDIAVRAARIVNAAGPQVDHVRRALGIAGDDLVRTSRGSHLVLAARDCETSLAAFLPDGRIQFVIPHPNGTLCGTTDVEEPVADEPTVPAADVDYLLGALAHLLEEPPGRADIAFAYCGWRSLPARSGPPGALNREAFTVEEACAAGPVHSVVGGKLTTHRSFAERVLRSLSGDRSPSPTRDQPLPGGDGPREPADPLWWRHGSRAPLVRALAGNARALLEPICPHRPFLAVEAVHAMRARGAVTFTDLALRRLLDVRGPCLAEPCVRALHDLYAAECPRAVMPDFARDRDELVAAVARVVGAARVTKG